MEEVNFPHSHTWAHTHTYTHILLRLHRCLTGLFTCEEPLVLAAMPESDSERLLFPDTKPQLPHEISGSASEQTSCAFRHFFCSFHMP
jgi:hypothetical protein